MILRRLIAGLGVLALAVTLALLPASAAAQFVEPAPDRAEGDGPFDRLVIRGAIVIDGTGAPPRGPVDIVIEGNRITQIAGVGYPGLPIDESRRPAPGDHEIDAHGMYVLPGFVDMHLHTGGLPKTPQAEYVYKLWLAHGVTAGRGIEYGPVDFSLSERERANNNEITAPRMFVYQRPGQGWDRGPVFTPEQARDWVRWAHDQGIDGIKFVAYAPEIMEALLDEAGQLGMGSVAHLAQLGVAQMNAIDAARLGLGTVTHFYGLFEALYDDHDVQPWPSDMNYANEQHRFGQVAAQWDLIHPQGSDEWNAMLEELLSYDVILDPTMTAYLASRDVMRARTAEWHERYTLPSLWDFYEPSRENHGSYYYDWTTHDEIRWRNFYRVWMDLLDDYKDMGGRVTIGSDAGFIYNLFGFSTIEEMELLQEAGFHPLEVIRGATMHGAEAIFDPKGMMPEFGIVREGLLADLVISPENPIDNLKVLYGTGHERLNPETGVKERIGGIRYTIKDGIIYDARQLLEDVARMVEEQKRERASVSGG
ncbi:MAG: amidohydrolase family protein [Gemmatimonadota bacterium]|nr:amidohydrolase family protein [Gemmatimonadota bacterium]